MSTLIIDCISDTHNKHKTLNLEGGDILIHSGDATGRGEKKEILNFLDWYADQDYSHLVFVPGNHDFGFERDPGFWKEQCMNRGIHLLNDSALLIKDIYDPTVNLKIYGSPITPWFYNWAFNRHRGEEIKKHWDLIVPDTEILVTHGPAHGIRDLVINGYSPNNGENVGCEDLARKMAELKFLKLHVFGHIHYCAGVTELEKYTAVNAAILGEDYKPNSVGVTRLFRTMHDDGPKYTLNVNL